MDVTRVPFIPPAIPRLRPSPPAGEGWIHELKLDGYRIQLHKAGRAVIIYSKNGADFTRRFPAIAAAVLALPVSAYIIDGELSKPPAKAAAILQKPFSEDELIETLCSVVGRLR